MTPRQAAIRYILHRLSQVKLLEDLLNGRAIWYNEFHGMLIYSCFLHVILYNHTNVNTLYWRSPISLIYKHFYLEMGLCFVV